MTTDLKRGFIEQAIQKYATQNEIDDKDQAYQFWVYSTLFEIDFEDIPFDEIVDGAGERQIDIFKIDIDEPTQTVSVHLIQCKNTNGFSSNVVTLMRGALDFIFKAPKDQYEKIKNPRFVEKIREVRDAALEYGTNSIDVTCHFCTMGDENDISEECMQNRDIILGEFSHSGFFSEFNFNFLGANELHRLFNLRQNKNRVINYDLPIIYDANRASIIEFDDGGVGSVLCTVSGKELAKLSQSEPRDAVFDINVRGHLGLGGQVNKNIYASAIDPNKAKMFWFMNNGITVVCDEFKIVRDPDNPIVKVKNLQIINGCQTTSTIRSAFESQELRPEVQLQVKIYSSKDSDFVDNVVIATNNQNSIVSRDLHANDEVQELIQKTINDKFALFYERKRGEAKAAGVPASSVIKLEKAGQAYLAMCMRQPTVSRAQKYKVYSNELYPKIFGDSKPWQLAVAHELYKFCDAKGRKAYRELPPDNALRNILNYGVFHIARIFWQELENAGLISENEAKNTIEKSKGASKELEAAYERSQKIMETIVRENNESLLNLNNYFKKSLSQQHINKYLKESRKEAINEGIV